MNLGMFSQAVQYFSTEIPQSGHPFYVSAFYCNGRYDIVVERIPLLE